ncbi:MAG: 30S ribosomal protein S1 [Alphaproteobacteria bacterium]|uniref:30S ribosomal protein S1 n=1 Tax=PS1 clade bacterium TaxID=2175152 RepID=A0A368DSV5_9PROT|nr:30S ribosomal protein S1 [Rhodobiaceae bacterium]OUT75010.1 MAG: 30S ribosomal protein S1 [Rhizobiales bacterium TMED25]RCL74363.1 MAG: 30S ribosomal protein S1 [PS1 clade bacterium]|tara:strand:- start:18981 stop:20801 length:1821 start_codon:yes stop_codon:yes gene_type:complete
MTKNDLEKLNPSVDDFAALLEESLSKINLEEGKVVTGKVSAIENDFVIVDVGLKTEGRIPVREFKSSAGTNLPSTGDSVDVYLDRVENSNGEAVLSREKAKRQESWNKLEKLHADGVKVEGVIFGRVKGGFTVDLDGAIAFLPGSQVDVKPVRDVGGMLNVMQPFQILKMDKKRGNIVVSRRALIEESKGEHNRELVDSLEEGQTLDGIVKNITDYGAFIDMGGMDGLLHVTDISWKRVTHPSDLLKIGQSVKVQIIKINPESKRVSLGMKQLEADPWQNMSEKYPVNTRLKGSVTNITDYGAFVEIEPGIEGLTHVSEMSWTKKNIHPGKIVSSSQEVEVVILEIDYEKRRISLGMKQCVENPWAKFAENSPIGSILSGEVKNSTEFGLFIGLEGDLDGMIHLSDLDWNEKSESALEKYQKGQTVDVKVLDIDVEKERISLGIKQLSEDPFSGLKQIKKGDVVTCHITQIRDGGLDVTIGKDGIASSIKRSDLSVDKSEQRPERYAVGELVDAKVTQIDAKSNKLTLSIKSLQIEQEKEAVEQYGSADSGASLGDILGEALSLSGESPIEAESETKAEKTKPKAKKTAKKIVEKEDLDKPEETKE